MASQTSPRVRVFDDHLTDVNTRRETVAQPITVNAEIGGVLLIEGKGGADV
jgi:hypothetical protein